MCRKLTYLFCFVLVLGPAAGVANADLTEGLVAYWTLDDGSGTTAVDVVGGHNGTLVNGPVWTPPGDFKMGTGALQFDGVDDVVSIEPFDVIGGGITLAAWMKPDSFGINDGRVISKANEWLADDHWWMLSTISSGGEMRLRFRLKTNDGQAVPTLIATSGNLVVGEWHHWAATWDGTTMRLYSNTVEAGSTPKGGTAVATDPTVSVAIGSQPPDAFAPATPDHVVKYFHGVIDDVINCLRVVVESRHWRKDNCSPLTEFRHAPEVTQMQWGFSNNKDQSFPFFQSYIGGTDQKVH